MEKVSQDLKDKYFNALFNQQNGNNEPMKRFKMEHEDLYRIINAMYHKRVKVLKDIKFMREVSHNKVYFGTLTFNDTKDGNIEASKRKNVFNFLNTILLCFLVVEEYGEDNGRYHIHYVGIFKEGKTFQDIFSWHSRVQIERVKSPRSVARYLCDYVVKQVPRLRRNKTLINLSKELQKSAHWSVIGFSSIGEIHKARAYETLFLCDL